MPNISAHGGGCCGVSHIRGFNYFNENHTVEFIRRELSRCFDGVSPRRGNPNRLAEVILTDNQLSFRNLPIALAKEGFVLVNRFRNSNSGNVCNVFHKVRTPLSTEPANLPYRWDPALRETFRRVYRSSTRGYFESLEEALAGAGKTLVAIVKVSGETTETVYTVPQG